MPTLRLGGLAFPGGGCGGGGKLQHKSAFSGVFQRRFYHVRHKVFNSPGEVFLQIKRFVHATMSFANAFTAFRSSAFGLPAGRFDQRRRADVDKLSDLRARALQEDYDLTVHTCPTDAVAEEKDIGILFQRDIDAFRLDAKLSGDCVGQVFSCSMPLSQLSPPSSEPPSSKPPSSAAVKLSKEALPSAAANPSSPWPP